MHLYIQASSLIGGTHSQKHNSQQNQAMAVPKGTLKECMLELDPETHMFEFITHSPRNMAIYDSITEMEFDDDNKLVGLLKMMTRITLLHGAQSLV